MELVSKVLFQCPQFTLREGESTADLAVEVSEEMKQQMLTDYVGWFEVVKEAENTEEPVGKPRKK